MTELELIALAKEAAKNAYVPYSHHTVGAALLSKSGKVYLGCNIENAAYSPTNCAERTAFFKAISEGEREFEAIAVADYFAPCGVCRQVMAEFCDMDSFCVIFGKNGEEFKSFILREILPFGFSPSDLKKPQL